jgi:hypothetical protein
LIDYCHRQLAHVLSENCEYSSRKSLPGVAQIYQELTALADEFAAVELIQESHEICARTEPIVLEGIDLGPFEIRLDWLNLHQSTCYRIVATDPNPAAANESVTHPHVQDDCLCEGDGRASLQLALDEGRICDFFVMIGRLLETYARGRAYVELSEWSGTPCYDCSSSVSQEDSYYCGRCEETLCGDCSEQCEACGSSFCSRCISSCPRCTEPCCQSCLDSCSRCGTSACSSCLTDDICETCRELINVDQQKGDQQELVQAKVAATAAGPSASATLQPNGLGKTDLSA